MWVARGPNAPRGPVGFRSEGADRGPRVGGDAAAHRPAAPPAPPSVAPGVTAAGRLAGVSPGRLARGGRLAEPGPVPFVKQHVPVR